MEKDGFLSCIIKLKVNRGLIAINAFIRGNMKYFQKKKYNQKKVLIVFQQIFGDSVVIQDSLEEYTRIFAKKNGYEITFIARETVNTFMQETLKISKEILVENVDFKRFLEDYKYYKEIVKKYLNEVDMLIVPGTSLSAEIFSASSNASRKIGLIRSEKVKKPLVMKVFSKLAYTEVIKPDKEDMMLQRHRLLVNYLGDNSYKAKLPTLLPKEKVIKENHYCVLCPGASKMEKCWPTERYVQIIDFIIERYDMNVHLCGGSNETEFERIILANSKYPKRLISHIGKTTFSEWSAIVQHADLVLGNDSATMHMAVASRRKAICIAGVYDKFQFFPYKVDILEEGDRLPVTILKDMPCEWCRTIGYHAGYGNAECKKRIKNNQCALCVDAITVEEVKVQVEKIMLEN